MPWIHEPKTLDIIESWHLRMSDQDTSGLRMYKDVDSGWIVTYRDWVIDDLLECSVETAQVMAEESLRRLLTNDLALLEERCDRSQ